MLLSYINIITIPIMNITFFSPFSATMEWKSQELAIQKFINKNKRYKLNVLGCNGILKKNCPAIDSFNHLEKNGVSNYKFEDDNLNQIYLKNIGWEFSHLRSNDEKEWLYNTVEKKNISLSPEVKLNLLKRLIHVENFEQFLHKSFVGARWYGLEGSEALIIILDEIINGFENYDSINFGMPHRGRLNVLAHIFDKPYSEIFSEFKEENINHMSSGNVDEYLRDVKYHLGAKKST